jgi:RNA polymerase sigma factor (TIGR02999 family)
MRLEPSDDVIGAHRERPGPAPAGSDALDVSASLPLLYGELHRLADRLMKRQRRDHTLQPTALVHEACLKLISVPDPRFDDRRHFLAAAAKAMRAVLVDHSRARGADKRGGGRSRLALDDDVAGAPEPHAVLALHDALEALARVDPQLAELVELRWFGGMTVEEVAHVLAVSESTVKRGWRIARAWLRDELSDHEHAHDG